MNEKLQYASMLEIPVNTCNVTYQITKKKRSRKKKKVNPDQVKEQLFNKINSQSEQESQQAVLPEQASDTVYAENYGGYGDEIDYKVLGENEPNQSYEQTVSEQPKMKKKFKFTVIGVQLAVIGALIATIFLTNAFYADSGINVFLKSIFGTEQTLEAVDERTYEQFAPVIAVGDGALAVDEGVITFNGKGSVYAPCDGTVSKITKAEDGTFNMEITHSDNFKSLLCGLIHVYAAEGDGVFSNIPVGYYNGESANMCFMSGEGAVISDYKIVDNSVVWEA